MSLRRRILKRTIRQGFTADWARMQRNLALLALLLTCSGKRTKAEAVRRNAEALRQHETTCVRAVIQAGPAGE